MIKFNQNCWKCNDKFVYIKNIKLEKLDMYEFKCSWCEQGILVPKTNPDLIIEKELIE